MKIGIIGTGRIGSSVGGAWVAAGHDVMFGLRDIAKDIALPGRIGTVEDACAHGDVVLFAIPGGAMLDTVRTLSLTGKIVIDATNGGGTPDQPVVRAVAAALPDSQVYKAFNVLGFENFQTPNFGDDKATLLFVGPESQQSVVAGLISDVGLEPLYVGGLDQTPILDAALTLWFGLSRRFGRHLGYRILKD